MREGAKIENCCFMYKYKQNQDEQCYIELEVRTGWQRCRYVYWIQSAFISFLIFLRRTKVYALNSRMIVHWAQSLFPQCWKNPAELEAYGVQLGIYLYIKNWKGRNKDILTFR